MGRPKTTGKSHNKSSSTYLSKRSGSVNCSKQRTLFQVMKKNTIEEDVSDEQSSVNIDDLNKASGEEDSCNSKNDTEMNSDSEHDNALDTDDNDNSDMKAGCSSSTIDEVVPTTSTCHNYLTEHQIQANLEMKYVSI